MFHVTIWVFVLLLLALLVCWLAKANTPQTSKSRKYLNPQDLESQFPDIEVIDSSVNIRPTRKSRTFDSQTSKPSNNRTSKPQTFDSRTFDSRKSRISNPPESVTEVTKVTDRPNVAKNLIITNQIEDLNDDEALQFLMRKSKLAQQIVPDFPSYPTSFQFQEPKKIKELGKSKYANSIGQKCCNEFLEALFPGKKFQKAYPEWLKHPRIQKKLPLIGFCEELMIAVEYNGTQHYIWPNFTNCTKKQFLQQKFRDDLKEQKCPDHNVCLIRIPFTVPLKRIPLNIYARLLDGVPGIN